MVDWTSTMQQTFEFYTVDPSSWRDVKRLDNVVSCTITRDSSSETLGSATIDVTESIGESYIRVYLVTNQNGVTEKHPLGTFLAQTPTSKFDGRIRSVSMDAYTPLLELKEKQPPIGYHIPKGSDIMEYVYNLANENARAPVSEPVASSSKLITDSTADPNHTWLTYLSELLTGAYTSTFYKVILEGDAYTRTIETLDPVSGVEVPGAKTASGERVYSVTAEDGSVMYYCMVDNTTRYRFDVDELGRIQFLPEQNVESLAPVWTYTDDNSSILYPELSMDHDLYGIPNVVEVIYSDGRVNYEHTERNDDPNSSVSTVARGREIRLRVRDPELYGTPTQERIEEYAKTLLKTMSSVEYTITYTHGYCPVRVGDGVRLNYSRAGLTNVKAKVVSQTIKCQPGCPVTEKAVFTAKLWG